MKKKNLVKALFGVILGFGAVALATPIFAEETQLEATTTSVVEETSQEEVKEETTTPVKETSVTPATTQEATTSEEVEEEESAFQKILNKLSKSELKSIITAIVVKFGADTAILLYLAIYIMKKRAKELLQNQTYQDTISKLNKEHQEEISNLTNNFVKQLEELNVQVKNVIAKQNSDARIEAKKTAEDLMSKLDDIKVDLD